MARQHIMARLAISFLFLVCRLLFMPTRARFIRETYPFPRPSVRTPRATMAVGDQHVKENKHTVLTLVALLCIEDLSCRDAIVFSPGHRNPAKAPAIPITNIEDSAITYNNSVSAFNPREFNLLQRRDALRCDNGPCVDGRYVTCCR
jgi:hypothetical protein